MTDTVLREYSPITTALEAGGVGHVDTAHAAKAVIRTWLERNHTAPLRCYMLTYSCVVSAAAALELANVFTGKVALAPAHGQIVKDTPGFLKRWSNLFHPDSDDLESALESLVTACLVQHQIAVDADINRKQALEFLPQSAEQKVLLTGSLLDFFGLYSSVHYLRDNHPDSCKITNEIWGDIYNKYPEFAEPAVEVLGGRKA